MGQTCLATCSPENMDICSGFSSFTLTVAKVECEIKPPDNNFAIYEVRCITSPCRMCLPLNPTPFHMLWFKKDHNPIHSREWQNNILQSKNIWTMITKHQTTLSIAVPIYTQEQKWVTFQSPQNHKFPVSLHTLGRLQTQEKNKAPT